MAECIFDPLQAFRIRLTTEDVLHADAHTKSGIDFLDRLLQDNACNIESRACRAQAQSLVVQGVCVLRQQLEVVP